MGKPTGFIEYQREEAPHRDPAERIADYHEFEERLPKERLERQAARCMDCGIPFCHGYGCPVKNLIPEWNDLVYRGRWKMAVERLHATNNLPEVTGRICPAPCESSCTLAINQPAVSIKQIELCIVEKGWEEGWIVPEPAEAKTGRKVAVVGSGPAGLSAAQQLARAGHDVVVFERAPKAGGLLRYGIPDFKLEKSILDRRIAQMQAEGVVFECGVNAGVDVSAHYLQSRFDAVVLCAGATTPRDLTVPGRDLSGVHFAMEFLTQSNMRVDGMPFEGDEILAGGKRVVVIGGGDTGADCVGTSRRQGAKSITQVELLPEPPKDRPFGNPWPTWPQTLRTSYAHEEGCTRLWSIQTKELLGKDGVVTGVACVKLEWSEPDASGRRSFKEIPESEFTLPADRVFLAMGFVHVEHGPLVRDLGVSIDQRGNVVTDANLMTTVPGVFAAGDSAMGASLVVRAINQGRIAAAGATAYLDAKK